MAADFNLTFGKKTTEGKITQDTFKGGIKKEQIKNKELLDIFNAVDDGDGVLDSGEMEKLKDLVIKAAGDDNLSKREAAKLLRDNNIRNATPEELFEFMNELNEAGSEIESSIVHQNGENKTVVITYKDGTTETINPNKTKEIVTKDGKKTVKNSDNQIMYTEESDDEGNTVRTEYENGQKIKIIKTGKGGNPVTTTYLDENGNPVRAEKINGTTQESYVYNEGSDEPELVRSVENKGIPAKEKITEYTYNEDGTVIANIKEYGKETTRTVKDGKVLAEIVEEQGKTTERIYDENGYTETVSDGESTTTTEFNNDDKKISQTKNVDGKEYTVEYDGNGNTKVILQNGESIDAIAQKFGCTKQELYDVNGGKIRGWAGDDVVIPGELAADDTRLQGRQTKEEAVEGYKEVAEEIQTVNDEADARKPISFTNKDYDTYEELARALFRREGIENPSERQMKARIEDLKKTNPEIKDGELKGKRITANVSQGMHDRVAAKQKTAEEYNKKQEAKKDAESLAKAFYQIADDYSGHISLNKMQEFLDENVDKSNIVEFLDAYDKEDVRKGDSSIIDTITSEKLPSGDRDVQKKVLRTIMTHLVDAAREAGVSDGDIEKARTEFENSITEEYDSISGAFRFTNPKDMEKAIDFLRGAIVAKQTGGSEITDNEAIETFNEDFAATDADAQKMYEDAREEEGWTAKVGDTVLGWFGCTTIEDMDKKLGENSEAVKRLAAAAENPEEFKAIYKEVFGIEFDKNKIAARDTALGNLQQAQNLATTLKITTEILEGSEDKDYSTLRNEIKEKFRFEDEILDSVIASYADLIGKEITTDADKKTMLLRFLQSIQDDSQTEYQSLTNGKSLEQMQKDLDLLTKSAFGTNDIVKDVIQFNENQQMTEMVTEAAFEIAGTMALQFVPGLGQMAAARLAVSAARWGSKAVKVATYAEKGFAAAKNITEGKAVADAARGAKVINKAGEIGSQVVNAGVATAAVGITNGDEAKEVMRKTLMNMSFAGAGASSSKLAPKLMKAFGIKDRRLANEIAEEIMNAASSYGITKLAGDDYGTSDAFLDFATGLVMSRISHVKTATPDADAPAVKLETETPAAGTKVTPESPSTPSDISPAGAKEADIVSDTPAARGSDAAKVEVDEIKTSSNKIIESISDAEIPEAQRGLWADIKGQYNEISTMLKTSASVGVDALLAKCRVLSSNLETMRQSATGVLKSKLEQLSANVQKLMDRIGISIKSNDTNPGFKPVKNAQEAEKVYKKMISDRFIGEAVPDDGKPIFWNKGGEPWHYTLYKNGSKEQGTQWKMHLYANSPEEWANVAQLAMPYLMKNEVEFKTMLGLDEEEFEAIRNTLNSAGEASQTGKAFTIYFESEEEFLQTAKALEEIFAKSGLKSSGTVMNEAQIGDSGFISYRHEGAERGTQYKPDNIEDPYLKMKEAEAGAGAENKSIDSVPADKPEINQNEADVQMQVNDYQSNVANLKQVMPNVDEKIITNLADQISRKPEIADKLMELSTSGRFWYYDLPELINMANKDNIDDLLKLSQNSNLRLWYDGDGNLLANDFATVLKIAEVNPEFRTQIMDIAVNSGREQVDVYAFTELMKKYPDNADDITRLAISNKNIKVGYDVNNKPITDVDYIMGAINQYPEFKNEILDYMAVQRKAMNDTSDPVKWLGYHVQNLKDFPEHKDVIMALSKDPNLDAVAIGNLLYANAADPEKLQDIVKLAGKKYNEGTINKIMQQVEQNPEFRDIYLADSPEFTLIDKTPDKTSMDVLEKRFDVRDKVQASAPKELEELKRTLGDDFYNKVRWEEIIPDNATPAEIKEILSTLNDEAKFFARTSVNENEYGKNIKWAHEMNQISRAASVRIQEGQSFYDVIDMVASDYRSYDIATTLDSNSGMNARRQYSGVYRGYDNDSGYSTPFDKTYNYVEYYDRFKQMLDSAESGIARPKPYDDIELTNFANTGRGDCMIHPPSHAVEPALKHMEDRYNELTPLFEKVKNGGTLTDAEKALANDKIAEIYYLMGNVMPWSRGSNGISDIFMRSMYKSLGINQPALKRGVSLDLEAFCMPMDEYKAKWNTFFEEPV